MRLQGHRFTLTHSNAETMRGHEIWKEKNTISIFEHTGLVKLNIVTALIFYWPIDLLVLLRKIYAARKHFPRPKAAPYFTSANSMCSDEVSLWEALAWYFKVY